MKHLTAKYSEKPHKDRIFEFYFGGMRIGVLDIETTGLNPSRNKFILGGIYDCSTATLHQYFAENRSEEEEALTGFLSLLDNIDMIITYNGRHFDVPFMIKRMNTLKRQPPGRSADTEALILPYNLDLYLTVNGYSPIKQFLPNLKQKTVENYMGLWQNRKDEISGAESVELYNRYEKTGDLKLEEKILLHNSDDIMQLTKLSEVIKKCDFHKAMYYLGYPAGPLTVTKIRTGRDYIDISGLQTYAAVDYRRFASGSFPASAQFTQSDSAFSIRIPAIRNSGLLIVDLEEFGINSDEFNIYPEYGSGFLVVEDSSGQKHMQINHFIKRFIDIFVSESAVYDNIELKGKDYGYQR